MVDGVSMKASDVHLLLSDTICDNTHYIHSFSSSSRTCRSFHSKYVMEVLNFKL